MSLKKRMIVVAALASGLFACHNENATNADLTHSLPPDTSRVDPQNPTPSPSDSAPDNPSYTTQVLLYNGSGVSTSDWQSTEQIIKSQGMSYRLVNASQLNAMSLDEIASYGVMVVPGGSGGTITSGIQSSTRLLVRQAVRERGMGYVGFCAGAWVAVGPEAESSKVASYGLAVAKGSVLDLYYPNGQQPTAAIVDVAFSDKSSRNLVWWGGPSTPEWANGVVARYETGEPAISEAWSGKGYVVISGPHPEAPQGWRSTAGNDPDGLDYDIAINMINAALKKKPLPAY